MRHMFGFAAALILSAGIVSTAEAKPECDVWDVDYYNLPDDHPDVEGEITGYNPGTVPFQYDWFSPAYHSYASTWPSLWIEEWSDFFPVDDGLENDPFYFAAHFTTKVSVAATASCKSVMKGDDDAWFYVDGQLINDVGGVKPIGAVSVIEHFTMAPGEHTFDIYFAERHKVQSGLVFRIECLEPLTVVCDREEPEPTPDAGVPPSPDAGVPCEPDAGTEEPGPDAGVPCEACVGRDGGPNEPTPDGGSEPDAGTPECGDGVCHVAEDCISCWVDCGSCPERDPRPEAPDFELVGFRTPVDPPVPPAPVEEYGVRGGGCSSSGGMVGLGFVLGILFLLAFRGKKRIVLSTPIVLFLTARAVAQPAVATQDMNLERVFLATDPNAILTVDSGSVSVSPVELLVQLGYMNDPLVLNQYEPREDRVGALVSDRLTFRVSAAWKLSMISDRLSLTAGLPVVVSQNRDYGTGSFSQSGLANPEVGLRGVVVSGGKRGTNLGLELNYLLPWGTGDGYIYGDAIATRGGVMGSTTLLGLRFAVNTGLNLRERKLTYDSEFVTELYTNVGVGLPVGKNELGININTAVPFRDKGEFYAEALGGITVPVNEWFTFHAAAGAGVANGHGAPDFRMLAGIRLTIPEKTRMMPPVKPADPVIVTTPPETTPDPEPLPEPEPVLVYIEEVYFPFDSAELVLSQKKKLDVVVDTLVHKDVSIAVAGYTDAIGPRAYNVDLSQRRAKAVIAYIEEKLLERGSDMRVESTDIPQGESTNNDNRTVDGRARNRRAEVYYKVLNQNGKETITIRKVSDPEDTFDSFGDNVRIRDR